MSKGVVICSSCERKVHQDGNKWTHCDDGTPRCLNALSVNAEPAMSPHAFIATRTGKNKVGPVVDPSKAVIPWWKFCDLCGEAVDSDVHTESTQAQRDDALIDAIEESVKSHCPQCGTPQEGADDALCFVCLGLV